MAKQIENVTCQEFDFMKSQGWITDAGDVTKAGQQAIFGGNPLPADGIEYRRTGAPEGTAVAFPVEKSPSSPTE